MAIGLPDALSGRCDRKSGPGTVSRSDCQAYPMTPASTPQASHINTFVPVSGPLRELRVEILRQLLNSGDRRNNSGDRRKVF